MTLPAKVLVTGAELGLSRARDARLSVWAPVWAELPACRNAEPASDLWTALDEELPSALPATEATWGEVCLLFLLMLNSWPHDSRKAPRGLDTLTVFSYSILESARAKVGYRRRLPAYAGRAGGLSQHL